MIQNTIVIATGDGLPSHSPWQHVHIVLPGKATRTKDLPPLSARYQFADFTLDSRHPVLYQGEMKITITPNLVNLLLIFVRHPRKIINDEIISNLTANQPSEPDDGSIDSQVTQLRRLLNDRNQLLIKTLPGQGHYFTAEVTHG